MKNCNLIWSMFFELSYLFFFSLEITTKTTNNIISQNCMVFAFLTHLTHLTLTNQIRNVKNKFENFNDRKNAKFVQIIRLTFNKTNKT